MFHLVGITDYFGIHALLIPKISSIKSVFKDFPEPWKIKKIQELSRKSGHPCFIFHIF